MNTQPKLDDDQSTEFVSLIAGGQGFCIDIIEIREIRRWAPVTPLPFSDDAVLGVMNLRGAVIPIFDLAAKLGLGVIEPTSRHVIIVVRMCNRTIGLLVDAVSEILSIDSEKIKKNPETTSCPENQAIRGLASTEGDMTRVLDLPSLFFDMQEKAA